MSYTPEHVTHFAQTINIEVNLSKEDRKRLDEVIAVLGIVASMLDRSAPTEDSPEETPAEIPAADPVVEPPVEETPAPVAETTEEVKPVSLAEFQKAVTLAVSKGAEAKKAAKEIINKYAASVSAVPEDKRAEVMAELANI